MVEPMNQPSLFDPLPPEPTGRIIHRPVPGTPAHRALLDKEQWARDQTIVWSFLRAMDWVLEIDPAANPVFNGYYTQRRLYALRNPQAQLQTTWLCAIQDAQEQALHLSVFHRLIDHNPQLIAYVESQYPHYITTLPAPLEAAQVRAVLRHRLAATHRPKDSPS